MTLEVQGEYENKVKEENEDEGVWEKRKEEEN